MRASLGLIAALTAAACTAAPSKLAPAAVPGTQVSMDFTLSTGFYAAPFPSETRRLPDSGIDLSHFPNPQNNTLVDSVVSLIESDVDGFGISSGIYFAMSGSLDAGSLPDLYGSVDPSSSVFLVSVDPRSLDYQQRHPIAVHYADANGPYGTSNLLSLLPYQGFPLQPKTLYAAVVMREVRDTQGTRLGVSSSMAQLAGGVAPPGMSASAFATYQQALQELQEVGIASVDIAGLAVFETWDPTATFRRFLDYTLAQPLPSPQGPFTLLGVYPTYCAYTSTIAIPDYQTGISPYTASGGGWATDATGTPMLQGMADAGFLITVPRQAMPASGFPVVIFSSTGAGGALPLVNRGTQLSPTSGPEVPGTGPAYFYGDVGWAGASIDGPLEGLRSAPGENEDGAIINFDNPPALVGNLRQSALELALAAHILPTVQLSPSDCPGLSTPNDDPVRFDASLVVVQGHSLGATIAPLALASDPAFKAGIFDGEGSSWIDNVLYKQLPTPVLPLAELLLLGDSFPPDGGTVPLQLPGEPVPYSFTEVDPFLTLLQWAGEPADPAAYGAQIFRQPGSQPAKHVLMFQGIVDHYILPPIANASSLAFGLDLAGPQYDFAAPSLTQFTPLRSLLPLSGGQQIALPATANQVAGDGSAVTAVVVQHVGDAYEDGHEEMFQTDPPKHQYSCFLQSLKSGPPTVPADGAALAPCP